MLLNLGRRVLAKLKPVILSAILVGSPFVAGGEEGIGICAGRSPRIFNLLEATLRKPCARMTADDLNFTRLDAFVLSISELAARDFTGLNVRHLNLNFNDIQAIQPGVLAPLQGLQILSLVANDIQDLRNLALGDVPRLEQLHLSENPFTELPVGIFDSLTELRVLDLIQCKIEHIPNRFFVNLRKLQRLNVTECPLSRTLKLKKRMASGALDETFA